MLGVYISLAHFCLLFQQTKQKEKDGVAHTDEETEKSLHRRPSRGEKVHLKIRLSVVFVGELDNRWVVKGHRQLYHVVFLLCTKHFSNVIQIFVKRQSSSKTLPRNNPT